VRKTDILTKSHAAGYFLTSNNSITDVYTGLKNTYGVNI
jgi:hypothetical protein